MKELKDLQVGDEVVIKGLGYPKRIAKIERATKTLFIVNGFRFYKTTGFQYMRQGYEWKAISVPTNEQKKKF